MSNKKSSLEEGETDVLKVSKPSNKFDEVFFKALLKEFAADKNLWRTLASVAEKMQIDAKDLDEFVAFVERQPCFCSKPSSKKEEVRYYALLERIIKETKDSVQEVKVDFKEEDKIAIAGLHSALLIYEAYLSKYALKIHKTNSDAFTMLTKGKDCLESGINLLSVKIKMDLNKLPKV